MPTIETARSWYSGSDPVHGIDHILRVYHMAERLALAEGADVEIVRAAALLHDAAGDPEAEPVEAARLEHQHASAAFARRVLLSEGWQEERIAAVEHCIRAHRFRDDAERPQTLEAKILFDADKLDATGAIGVARAIAFAARNGQPAYSKPSDQFLKTGRTAAGEPHSAYHEYLFKLGKLKDRLYTPSAIAIAAERHRIMTEFYEALAREVQGNR